MPERPGKRDLPPSVGFSITRLIEEGWVDDLLDFIGMCVQRRKRVLKDARTNRS